MPNPEDETEVLFTYLTKDGETKEGTITLIEPPFGIVSRFDLRAVLALCDALRLSDEMFLDDDD